ncbi:acetylornithine deacetylase [Acidovorax sp.]|uniref:acetylornithine deacetylase n=1 Tax=Acidovorax sp. TaxID=1872122 RepID=UPI00391FAD80
METWLDNHFNSKIAMNLRDPMPSTSMLAKLVGFDTTSSGSNLHLIEWVADYLESYKVQSTLSYNEDRSKANLFATLGAQDEAGVCLHGHTDVVPVAGQPWESDPFVLTERQGLLYGRGTSDMKAWIACALAAVPQIQNRRLRTPIHFALSYDEEVGCLGAPGMIDTFGKSVPKPLLAIVGEPSMMAPITAHKGVIALETSITGKDAHSSLLHLGLNAVSAAGGMAFELHRLASEWMVLPGPTGMRPSGPTINVGVARGGVARNVIPRHATLQWEIRFRAEDDVARLLQIATQRVEMRLREQFGPQYPALDVITTEVALIPAFDAKSGGLAENLCRKLGAKGPSQAVPYGAEAGQYANAGIPTVICGPGSINQAHQPNEFISLVQVHECDRFISRLCDWATEVKLAEQPDALTEG